MVRSLLSIICTLFLSLIATPVIADDWDKLQQRGAGIRFISLSEHPQIFTDPDSVAHLRSYHNQYLREPMYDDYLYVILQKMLGKQKFDHLFRNLGGGFVPIRIKDEQLIMKGAQDHCGGMEEGLILVEMNTGDVTTALYSADQFEVFSTHTALKQTPAQLYPWIERLLDANGSAEKPSRNKQLLRQMAGDWCQPPSG